MIYVYEGPSGFYPASIPISKNSEYIGEARQKTLEHNGDITRCTYKGIQGDAPKLIFLSVHSYDTGTAYMLTADFVEAKDEM